MLREFQAVFFKALAHPLRIRILDALRKGELTVNESRHRLGSSKARCPGGLRSLEAAIF